MLLTQENINIIYFWQVCNCVFQWCLKQRRSWVGLHQWQQQQQQQKQQVCTLYCLELVDIWIAYSKLKRYINLLNLLTYLLEVHFGNSCFMLVLIPTAYAFWNLATVSRHLTHRLFGETDRLSATPLNSTKFNKNRAETNHDVWRLRWLQVAQMVIRGLWSWRWESWSQFWCWSSSSLRSCILSGSAVGSPQVTDNFIII